MDPFSMGALGLGALNMGMDIMGGMDRAARIRLETAEMVRRFTDKSERTISTAEAVGAGSGVTTDSASLTKTLADMSTEFRRQANWMREAGNMGASAAEMTGMFQGIGDIGGAAMRFGQMNNWFRSPSVP